MPGRGQQAAPEDVLYGELGPRGMAPDASVLPSNIEVDTELLRLQDYFTAADGFSGNASWAVKAALPEEWLPEGAEESEYLGDEFTEWRVGTVMAGSDKCQFDIRGRDDYVHLDKACMEQRKAIEGLAHAAGEWRVIESEDAEVFAMYVTDTGELLGQLTL